MPQDCAATEGPTIPMPTKPANPFSAPKRSTVHCEDRRLFKSDLACVSGEFCATGAGGRGGGGGVNGGGKTKGHGNSGAGCFPVKRLFTATGLSCGGLAGVRGHPDTQQRESWRGGLRRARLEWARIASPHALWALVAVAWRACVDALRRARVEWARIAWPRALSSCGCCLARLCGRASEGSGGMGADRLATRSVGSCGCCLARLHGRASEG